jgi:hypothetical protein
LSASVAGYQPCFTDAASRSSPSQPRAMAHKRQVGKRRPVVSESRPSRSADTFDRVHGAQQLRLFDAYHDDYGFQPIVVFDGEGRFVTAVLRPGKRPSGVEIRGFVRRLIDAVRNHWPKVEIPGLRRGRLRCAPTAIMLARCRKNRVDWMLHRSTMASNLYRQARPTSATLSRTSQLGIRCLRQHYRREISPAV